MSLVQSLKKLTAKLERGLFVRVGSLDFPLLLSDMNTEELDIYW
jgi:hypothetical protein